MGQCRFFRLLLHQKSAIQRDSVLLYSLNDVFTLAHELGHSMHSYYSNKTQEYHYADYSIFVAEVASTTNELLLFNYLLETTDDKDFKAFLLGHLLDEIRSTIYRQTMFAEFELIMHELAEAGEPLLFRRYVRYGLAQSS